LNLKVFALNGTRSFGRQVAERLDVHLSEHEEYCFDDGECYIAPRTGIRDNVRGCDVFVISSMYSDEVESVNDKIIKTMILCGALRDASAARITLVAPYFPYARQDRKTASRAPITTKYIARITKAMWVDRILAIDVHNPTAIQNAHHVPCDLLEANTLFADHIQEMLDGVGGMNLTVLSPDSGGLVRARKFRKILSDRLGVEVGIACLDKVHAGREIRGYDIMGRDAVVGRDIVVFDDMISSGKTILECVNACMEHGRSARSVLCAAATHGLFVGGANDYLSHGDLGRILITDSIQPFRLGPEVASRLSVINTTRLFAEAIGRINKNESISDLLQHGSD
jgi:ribose-phosphate pyrophosphokinase